MTRIAQPLGRARTPGSGTGTENPNTGRHGITPSQTLRSLVLMRVKNWDYRELRERIDDGYTLRSFTEFDSHSVPQHDAFNCAFNRLTPDTMQAINRGGSPCAGARGRAAVRVDTGRRNWSAQERIGVYQDPADLLGHLDEVGVRAR